MAKKIAAKTVASTENKPRMPQRSAAVSGNEKKGLTPIPAAKKPRKAGARRSKPKP